MKLSIAITALVLAAGSASASAQAIKPGLWEIATQMQGGSGEMAGAMAQAQKQMESMPPEQRKMMQDMMAKQGVQMGAGGGAGMTIKICMTQEMVDRNEVSARQGANPGDCTHTNSPRVGNTMKFSFVCAKPPSSGEGQVTFTSPEAYSMKMATTSTVRGKPEKMEMQTAGRWLGANCGTIKPLALPKK
ncbi:MAG: DUF3617 domain-containing protein [Rhodoferax sp.]|nr:DUF3617 domain-containing protein [Rhodoferax sp.]